MGVEERREREKLARREAIVSSARELFLSQGFAGTTMDEVAHRTELSKGTLYLYFGSKEELYVTVISEGLRILFDRLEAAYRLTLTPEQMIRKLGEVIYRYYVDHPEYFRIFFFLQHRRDLTQVVPDELIQEMVKKGIQFMRLFADVIQQGIDEGMFAPVDPWRAAAAFWGATNGVLLLFEEELNREIIGVDVDQLIYYAVDLFIAGLRKQEGGTKDED